MFNKKEYDKQYRLEHWEEIKEKKEQYYKNNREKIREKKKKYYQENREKILKQNKQYSRDNPKRIRELRKKWAKNNPEKEKESKRNWNKNNPEYFQKWRENNREKINQRTNIWEKNRNKTDPKFNLGRRIKAAIQLSLKGNKNGRGWETLVGYTLNDLIKRLQDTMPKGYTWQDFLQGKLHVDHIIPIRAFTFNKPEDEEFKQCWSLWNLRLLPSKENILKKDSIDNPILLGLLLNN